MIVMQAGSDYQQTVEAESEERLFFRCRPSRSLTASKCSWVAVIVAPTRDVRSRGTLGGYWNDTLRRQYLIAGEWLWTPRVICPEGHGFAYARPVKVQHSDKPCGNICRGAKSEKCSCSCDGTNHGEAWRLSA